MISIAELRSRRAGDGYWNRVIERFWSSVETGADDACWPWTRTRLRSSIKSEAYYGLMSLYCQGATMQFLATHISLEIDGRPRPGRLQALHSCDNPICVNPRHLRWGTEQDNKDDMRLRGRSNRGERHGNSRLDANTVIAIRRETLPSSEVATKYGITARHVRDLRSGRAWSHITERR